jgi:hypothetical protein
VPSLQRSMYVRVKHRARPVILYPNQVFTVLIWGENRRKFGAPESEYKGKQICVTGKITEYRGAPEIVADDAQQIRAEK